MFIEMKDLAKKYAYCIHSDAKYHTNPPVFVLRDEAGVGFTSLYSVTKEDADAITSAGTTAGFKGVVWSERLWLDIDSYEQAEIVENRLKEMGLDYIAFDTGGRGAHFGVARDALPSHLLPAQDRDWAVRHFPECDSSIYTHLHLFRVDGTRHEKGGRNKGLVHRQRGKVLEHGQWERKEAAYGITVNSDYSSSAVSSVFKCFLVMSNSIPTKVGNRHPTYVRLVNALKNDAGVPLPVARWWLGEVNKMAEGGGYPEDHLDRLVTSLYG